MMFDVKIAAWFNVDSNVARVQIFIVSDSDDFYHPELILSGSAQLYNVYNLPGTGLQQVSLEMVAFDKSHAKQDGTFTVYFINPHVRTNLEARVSVNIQGQGVVNAVTVVQKEEGTFTDQPETSIIGEPNRSWHLDAEPERDGIYEDISPNNPLALGVNQVIIPDPEIVNVVYADIQFERLAEIKSSKDAPGNMIYIGGGNRLLPKPGKLVKQDIDVPPWELGASTFVEQSSIQVLPNNLYLQVANQHPNGYTMDSAGISVIRVHMQTLQAEGFDAKVWSLHLKGAAPASISPYSIASLGVKDPIAFDVSKPISLSLLAGMEKNTSDTTITDAKLYLKFYDFADNELPHLVKDIDVDELFNARPLKPFSMQAHPSQYPASTEKFTWRLEIGSVDQGDYIIVRTAIPSVTYTPSATSPVISTLVRSKDNLAYEPPVPLAVNEGAVVLNMAIGFEGAPGEVKYFFDGRNQATGDKGVALRVNADGSMTLVVQDDTSTATLSSPIYNWVSGQLTEVVAEWKNGLMRISVDGTILASNTVTLPANVDNFTMSPIQLGADFNISNMIDSEFIRIVFLKRPRS